MAKKAGAKSSFKKNGAPTLYTLRKVLGMKAKSASNYNRCIGAELVDGKFPNPPKGRGGRLDERIQAAFLKAKNKCKAETKKTAAAK